MLSEEEKAQIIERIKFEEAIRKELVAEKSDSKASIWKRLNSNLALLLIGSVITGLLVPLFQYTQRKLEWRRQIKYETIKFNLEMMRECVKEFVAGAAHTAEAYEITRPFIDKPAVDRDEYEKFKQQFLALQSSRIKQNAKVISLVIYFPDAGTTQKLIDDYVIKSSDNVSDMERYVNLKYCLSKSGNCEQSTAKDIDLEKLRESLEDTESSNDAFDRVIAKINEQIRRVENESEF